MGKYRVCPTCKGEGSVGPGWVFTQDDREQYDAEEFAELQADLRAGRHNVPCATCQGKRVVTAEELADARERADMARTEWMEAGCPQ